MARPTKYADLLASGTPWPLVLEFAKDGVKQTAAKDADLLASLEAVGFKLNDGPDGTGLMGYALAYGGGYYIDVGASTLIAEGKIKLAQGSGARGVHPDGIRLADGRTLEADLVVLATGYRNMRETARRLFGDDVADRLPLVLGVGEDGELGGLVPAHRPPGVLVHGRPARLGAHLLQAPGAADHREAGGDLPDVTPGTEVRTSPTVATAHPSTTPDGPDHHRSNHRRRPARSVSRRSTQ